MPSRPWQAGAARLACRLMASCVALVVAAGRGTRLGAALPKQYLPLAGKPLLRYSLETLARHPAIGGVRVVFNPDDRGHYEAASRGLHLLPPVAGGAARQDSVRLGLESLESVAAERVLIHDGARPFLDAATIDRVLGALDAAPGAIPALPLRDTVKRGAAGIVAETVDRTSLWRRRRHKASTTGPSSPRIAPRRAATFPTTRRWPSAPGSRCASSPAARRISR